MSEVEVVRGGLVESRHEVHVAVVHADGTLLASTGDPSRITYYRSAAKPMQALPLVEEGIADRFGLSTEEIALCCASHEGEPAHVEGALSILAKAEADPDLLRCGAHAPYSRRAAMDLTRSGQEPRRVHNNCSGKHAGMIALAVGMGWDPVDYHLAGHPVQKRMIEEVVRWSGVPDTRLPKGIDGCGVVCFAAPLEAMARSFATFTRAAADEGSGTARIVDAMTSHPFMVGGTGRTCTDVMDVAGKAVFVKLGAEGVYGGGLRGRDVGFAIKVADGGRRAVEVALIHVVASLDALTVHAFEARTPHGRPTLRNTRDEVVGEVRPAFDLLVHAQA